MREVSPYREQKMSSAKSSRAKEQGMKERKKMHAYIHAAHTITHSFAHTRHTERDTLLFLVLKTKHISFAIYCLLLAGEDVHFCFLFFHFSFFKVLDASPFFSSSSAFFHFLHFFLRLSLVCPLLLIFTAKNIISSFTLNLCRFVDQQDSPLTFYSAAATAFAPPPPSPAAAARYPSAADPTPAWAAP